MNQSQNSIALMDQSIEYNQTPLAPGGWNSIGGPASIQDHSFYMNNDNSYYQSRCIFRKNLTKSKKQKTINWEFFLFPN